MSTQTSRRLASKQSRRIPRSAGQPRREPNTTPKEADTQKAFFEWVKYKAAGDPRYNCILSMPNEGKRKPSYANYLRSMGMARGFPDILILVPTRDYPAAFIELKRAPNKPTPDQIAWLRRLEVQGYFCCVCWDLDELRQTVQWYLEGK